MILLWCVYKVSPSTNNGVACYTEVRGMMWVGERKEFTAGLVKAWRADVVNEEEEMEEDDDERDSVVCCMNYWFNI